MKKPLGFLLLLALAVAPAVHAESGRLIWQASWYNTPERTDPIRSMFLGGPVVQPAEKGTPHPATGKGPLRGSVVTDGDVSIKLLSVHRISPNALGMPAVQKLDFELEGASPEFREQTSRNQIDFKIPAFSFREKDVFMVIFETQKAGEAPVRHAKTLTLTLNLVMS